MSQSIYCRFLTIVQTSLSPCSCNISLSVTYSINPPTYIAVSLHTVLLSHYWIIDYCFGIFLRFLDMCTDATFIPFCTAVIPETPHFTQIEFENSSTSAVLQWKTTEPTAHLIPYTRLRARNGFWVKWEPCGCFQHHSCVCVNGGGDLISWCLVGRERRSAAQWGSDKSAQLEASYWIWVPDESM